MSNVEQLSALVRRITAPNPGPMTGAGTNTYLVGSREIAVIDPGPAVAAHIDTILNACDGHLKWVVVTHTHPDHSPAAQALLENTGAEPVGCVMDDDGHQDRTFQVDRNAREGDLVRSAEFCLRALHTPGHVGNHFCYLLEEEQKLFSGDHIIGGSSVVIVPPSGDMSDYLASLQKLQVLPIKTIAPGHGDLIHEPRAVVDKLIRHRLKREKKVIACLRELGESSLQTLLPAVYDDVDPALHKVAAYSLWAHLLKLEKDGTALKTIEKHWAFGEEHWKLL